MSDVKVADISGVEVGHLKHKLPKDIFSPWRNFGEMFLLHLQYDGIVT